MGARRHAPAKLTLSLRVVGVRPDGYHLIDAEMVTLALRRRRSTFADGGDVLDGRAGRGLRRGRAHADDGNLVVRKRS